MVWFKGHLGYTLHLVAALVLRGNPAAWHAWEVSCLIRCRVAAEVIVHGGSKTKSSEG
jgi:hypothetical protein